MTTFNYEAGTYERPDSFEPLPKGKYHVKIVNSEIIKSEKETTGNMLVLTFEVIIAPYKGRSLRKYLCLKHANPTVVKIAQNNLNGILESINQKVLSSTEQLLGKELMIDIYIKESDKGPRNEIGTYYKLETNHQTQVKSEDFSEEFGDDIPF